MLNQELIKQFINDEGYHRAVVKVGLENSSQITVSLLHKYKAEVRKELEDLHQLIFKSALREDPTILEDGINHVEYAVNKATSGVIKWVQEVRRLLPLPAYEL